MIRNLVIVSSFNKLFLNLGAVSKAIASAAGAQLQLDCQNIGEYFVVPDNFFELANILSIIFIQIIQITIFTLILWGN